MAIDLNYHHLRAFWLTAREGSIARSCVLLGVTQPTVSEQLRELERSVGEALFARAGRGLRLTAAGRMVQGHCDRIFSAGGDLARALADPAQRRRRLAIGVVDSMPKLLTSRMLAPALGVPEPPLLTVVEDRPERLLSDLALHQLDGVLTDLPLDRVAARVAVHEHALGDSPVAVYAPRSRPDLVALADGFPGTLSGAAMVMPAEGSQLRRALDDWLLARDLAPRIVAECQDGALVKAFARAGAGLFVAAASMEADLAAMYDAVPVGRIPSVRERWWWISAERRITHPAVLAVLAAARRGTRPTR